MIHVLAGTLATVPMSERVRAAVQPVLDQMAVDWNISFSFGFTDANSSIALAAGKNNVWLNVSDSLQPTTLLPLGSVTKPWTALRIMQLAEAGQLNLSDPVHKYVDPVLQRLYGNELRNLWGTDVRLVTVRDCLGMTSGLPDYSDKELELLTLQEAGDDIDPYVFLKNAARKGWLCAPGQCAMYSGVNFVLLGFVLVQLDGTFSWQECARDDSR